MLVKLERCSIDWVVLYRFYRYDFLGCRASGNVEGELEFYSPPSSIISCGFLDLGFLKGAAIS